MGAEWTRNPASLMITIALGIAIALPIPAQMFPPSAQAQSPPTAPAAGGKTFSQEELDQLLAPIALYPDALLAQVLMASTYPLEIVEAERWVKANPGLKDKALEDALQQQPWDPSVKSLAVFPQVLTMMSEKLDWTQKLGDAFLAQQKDVLATAQALRAKAAAQGSLKDSKQQKVVTEYGGQHDGHQDRADESRSRLRADVQPDRRVRRVAVSGVSAVLLLSARLRRRRRAARASRPASSSAARCGATATGAAATSTSTSTATTTSTAPTSRTATGTTTPTIAARCRIATRASPAAIRPRPGRRRRVARRVPRPRRRRAANRSSAATCSRDVQVARDARRSRHAQRGRDMSYSDRDMSGNRGSSAFDTRAAARRRATTATAATRA